MTGILKVVFSLFRRGYETLAEPLRTDPDSRPFRLSSPETHTTTIDGDVGWGHRPPAILECPRCSKPIEQHHPRDDIDCPHCVAERSHEDFPDVDLVAFRCPVCGDRMEHGTRHPQALSVPEWATCHRCRYHWEFKHTY